MRSLKYLWYRYRFKHPFLTGAKPVHMHLELNRSCNSKCPFCYRQNQDWKDRFGEPRIMTLFKMHEYLIQAYSNGIKAVKFNWRGEPNINTVGLNYGCMIAIGLGYYDVMINTNGFTQLSIEALRYLTHISYSIDDHRDDKYKLMRTGAKSLNDTLKNVIEDMKYTEAKITIQRIHDKYSPSVGEWVDGLVNKLHNLGMTRKEMDKIEFKSNIREYRGKYYIDRIGGYKNFCDEPARAITVGVDGKVWACPYAYYEQESLFLGDLNNNSLKEILKGNLRKEFIRKIKTGKLGLTYCSICPGKLEKGGC